MYTEIENAGIILLHLYWPLLTMAYGLYYIYLFGKAVMMKFLNLCNMLSASYSMLLYCHSALDRPLLVNTTWQRVAMPGTLSCPYFIPSLNCNKPAPPPMPVHPSLGTGHHEISYMHLL